MPATEFTSRGRGGLLRQYLALGLLWIAAAASRPGAQPAVPPAEVTVHADEPVGRFEAARYLNLSTPAVYADAVSPLADPALAWVRASGALRYVRCYNWLGDGIPRHRPEWSAGCRVARAGRDGRPEYEWTALERVIDTLLAAELKPFLVCGAAPDVLARGEPRRNEGGAAANPPRDLAAYGELLGQMVRRLEKTYGAEEVRSWYFEAWSQPDHEGSWEDGRAAPFAGEVPAARVESFLRYYDQFAAALTAADPRLRIGGPGLAGDRSFLRRFLEHCAPRTGGGRGGPRLDFVSWHQYGEPEAILRTNEELRAIVGRFPELSGARLILSESGPAGAESARANATVEAARLAALADGDSRAARGMDLLFRAGDLADDHFGGLRPLVTRVGGNTVPLPALRLNMLLARLGGERLRVEAPAGVGVIAARPLRKAEKNATQVLLYRYEPAVTGGAGMPLPLRVRVSGLSGSLLRLPLRVYRIDSESHAPWEAWVAAGSPRPAPEALGQKLAGTGVFPPEREELGQAIHGGAAVIEVGLRPNSVVLLTLGAEPFLPDEPGPRVRRLRKAEEEFDAAANLLRDGMAARAAEALRRVADRYRDTFWRETALLSLAGLYELDLRSPEDAAAVRRELLTLPLDDQSRLRLLQRVLVDAVRRGDARERGEFETEIAALQRRLAAMKSWPLRRYEGG